MGRLKKLTGFVVAAFSVADAASKWLKDHPEEAAKIKEKAKEVASSQDLRGPKLLLSAQRDAAQVRRSTKRGVDALDIPALDLLRSDYIRFIHKIKTTRRLADRELRDKQYTILEQELAELRFRWLEVLGHHKPQLPETD